MQLAALASTRRPVCVPTSARRVLLAPRHPLAPFAPVLVRAIRLRKRGSISWVVPESA